MDERTDGRTQGRTDNVKTVYPPQTKFAGGIITVYNNMFWVRKRRFFYPTKTLEKKRILLIFGGYIFLCHLLILSITGNSK